MYLRYFQSYSNFPSSRDRGSCLKKDLIPSQTSWKTTGLNNFVSHLSSALFRIILLVFRVTQFTDVSHPGCLIYCHTFLSFLLCFNKRSRPSISYFRYKIIVFPVDNLYTESTEVAKSRTVYQLH
jgi:hypothetical protein